MAVYLVTWNLNKEGSNYSNARAAFMLRLSAYEHVIDPGLETVAFVASSSTAQQISDYLQGAIDLTDRLVVSRMRDSEYQGILDPAYWAWINARV